MLLMYINCNKKICPYILQKERNFMRTSQYHKVKVCIIRHDFSIEQFSSTTTENNYKRSCLFKKQYFFICRRFVWNKPWQAEVEDSRGYAFYSAQWSSGHSCCHWVGCSEGHTEVLHHAFCKTLDNIVESESFVIVQVLV